MSNKIHWVAFRRDNPCAVFKNREEAVVWFRGILEQVLKDFKRQHEQIGYDYPIQFREININPVEQRPIHLGS